MNEDGELEGQWRIRREEVGGKEQQVRGDSKRDLKGHRTDCSNTSTHMLELCAWTTEDVILQLSLATLRKRNNKLTDETLVNEGLDMYKLTDEFRMIPSVF